MQSVLCVEWSHIFIVNQFVIILHFFKWKIAYKAIKFNQCVLHIEIDFMILLFDVRIYVYVRIICFLYVIHSTHMIETLVSYFIRKCH